MQFVNEVLYMYMFVFMIWILEVFNFKLVLGLLMN